jgi:hypothetical protein
MTKHYRLWDKHFNLLAEWDQGESLYITKGSYEDDDLSGEHICIDGYPDWGPPEGCPNCDPAVTN